MFGKTTKLELLEDLDDSSASSGSFTTHEDDDDVDQSMYSKREETLSDEVDDGTSEDEDEEEDDEEEDDDDEFDDEDEEGGLDYFSEDESTEEGTDVETEDESLAERKGGTSLNESTNGPTSSMDTLNRYATSRSHSFASDATEERGHVSSPRMLDASSSRRKQLLVPTLDKRGLGNKIQTPLTPPNVNSRSGGGRFPGGASPATSPVGLSTISGATSPTNSARGALLLRQRIPGGAAAKLIGKRTEPVEMHTVADGDDTVEVVAPVEELMKSRDKAKAEFAVGSVNNRRYHVASPDNKGSTMTDVVREASVPSILNRSEVFHENAAAAIVSLLSPVTADPKSRGSVTPMSPETSQILSTRTVEMQSRKSPNSKTRSQMTNPFHLPRKLEESTSIGDTRSDVSSGVGETAAEALTVTGKSPLVQKLMSKRSEQRLEAIKNRMKDPNKNLASLLAAIASPSDGAEADRHYMVRRKNACGALQVMTANSSHRVNICWTLGVLPSLTSVLEDSGSGALEDTFPDVPTRREFIEARTRAVAALMNLAVPKDNKLPIFHCPKLVASLIRVINQDEGESGRGCCAVLAHLSKSSENRLLMAQVPGLIDAITTVIAPKPRTLLNGDLDIGPSGEGSSGDDVFDKILSEDGADEEYDIEGGNSKSKKDQSEDAAEASARYDEDPNECLHGARNNVFALLMNLAKEKDNAFILARNTYLMDSLVAIARLQESSSQEFGLKLLAHFSRHRANSKVMVFKVKATVPAIVLATRSDSAESRKYACFALQNLSQDKPCRQELASIDNLLPAVCRRIRSAKDAEERLAALHTLKNLSDEPANLIPMTNTPECFATLMQIAHASDDSVTETMQYLGCDALATLSHWFRSIATSGQRIGTDKRDDEQAKDQLFVPTLKVVAWQPWQ